MKRFVCKVACILVLAALGITLPGCGDKERKLVRYSLKPAPLFDLSHCYSNSKWRSNLKYLYQPLPKPLNDAKIVVNKKRHILYLFSGDTLMRIYPINLGPDPLNDKIKAGDGRTPEGRYFICNKNPKSKYYKSLGISYPSKEDAKRGLEMGFISKKQYEAIVYAIDHGKRPPWFTRLGGAVCIHGGGIGWDWTRGCIALRNADVQELFEVTRVGTPVIIISGLPKEEKRIPQKPSLLTTANSVHKHRSLD